MARERRGPMGGEWSEGGGEGGGARRGARVPGERLGERITGAGERLEDRLLGRAPDRDAHVPGEHLGERIESASERFEQRVRELGASLDRGPFWGRGPKGYRRSDERVREDVSERIARYGWIDASDVEVAVESGIVILRGTVARRDDKRGLERLIEDVTGVEDVRNELRIRASGREEHRGLVGGIPRRPLT